MNTLDEEPDLSAFWLYPDWDGPLKQPFWMRPPKLPRIVGVKVLARADCSYAAVIEWGSDRAERRAYQCDPSRIEAALDAVGARA